MKKGCVKAAVLNFLRTFDEMPHDIVLKKLEKKTVSLKCFIRDFEYFEW